ncbi:MaoC family dehydratase [Rhodoplanes sp. TEM]|uniref:MaoC family dehydratase n=1 Tax=Rhodoplanes tepidamans TaxID=200616 RepID=A0ABT5JA39_RHOTP|nr:MULTISPECIES: MaoC family dehydratase [Rhodoplanes]MDC7786337.1 MaoC family dehydratase [Rhodoplanes tepidamans]MDC7984704.1 MaoC family dehydratase [Rhodoplanes sp. TEM]MDQ0354080.1 acyl dehydratase [Rhodoplanes tepidamans]
MITVETPLDLKAYEGQDLGRSDWTTVDQAMLSGFAALTGDDHWIHVDVARAAAEMPDGRTIAHGLLVLSLGPALQRQIYAIRRRGKGLNYGYDKVRFVSPIPVDARVRLALSLVSVAPHAMGARIVTRQTFEVEGADKPAVAAEHILLITNA